MNIKAFLKTVLVDHEITNLTGDKKVYFLHATNPVTPYIEYEIYNEDGALWTEGNETATNYYIQVDIFSKATDTPNKGDYTDLENKIKEKMINAGFARISSADLFEPDTKLYHKAMRFNYTT